MTPTREWGDFQTPPGLVDLVLDTVWARHDWSRILEPTCGYGNFLVGACKRAAGSIELRGFEIQSQYVLEAQRKLNALNCTAQVIQQSIFDVDLARIEWATRGPLLVVGNPPWVTNSELSLLNSGNVPLKSNFKRVSGYNARTGAANFDIAEYILLKLIRELGGQVGTVALLCKRIVAKNALEFASTSNLPIQNAAFYPVDAGKWFGAAVDACLFVCDIGSTVPRYSAEAFAALGDTARVAQMQVVAGHLVEDADAYARAAAAEGVSPVEWRQGIKHDAAPVAELRATNDGAFTNSLGEVVDVETAWLYPLLKSSDVFHGRSAAHRRAIVTQRSLRDDTAVLALVAPKLWSYLQSHLGLFAQRKSSIYLKRPAFAMFGIGSYTFAPFKVAVSGMYKPAVFRAIGPDNGMPVVLDDTCYFLPFGDGVSAAVVSALLSTDLVKAFMSSVTMPGAKRPVTKRVLQRIDLAAVAKAVPAEEVRRIARREYDRMTGGELNSLEIDACLASLLSAWSAAGAPAGSRRPNACTRQP